MKTIGSLKKEAIILHITNKMNNPYKIVLILKDDKYGKRIYVSDHKCEKFEFLYETNEPLLTIQRKLEKEMSLEKN